MARACVEILSHLIHLLRGAANPVATETSATGERERGERGWLDSGVGVPELLEVEAARRALEAHCVGGRIARCVIADDAKVVIAGKFTRVAFKRTMVGKTIVAARRRGKNLWLRLNAPPFPSFQFGMTGAIYIMGVAVTQYKRWAVNSTDDWPSKYSKFFVELDGGLELSFTDKRRFARIRLFEDVDAFTSSL